MKVIARPKTKTITRKRNKGVVYSCAKCKRAIEVYIPAVVVCGCGRRMMKE